jgi:hypothetical protein
MGELLKNGVELEFLISKSNKAWEILLSQALFTNHTELLIITVF